MTSRVMGSLLSLSTAAKKKQLNVDKPDDDVVVTDYDGYDDYDFM